MSRESYKAIERAKKIASMSMADQRAYLESEKRHEPESDSADSLHGVVTRLEWSKATTEARNAACAAFLPASDTNPMRTFYLKAYGKIKNRLLVENLKAAEAWLHAAKASKTNWEKLMPEMLWAERGILEVAEEIYHLRYSDTPGGAWMLIEHLTSKGWTVSVTTTQESSGVSAILGVQHHHVLGKMSEAVAECFLKVNGVDTSDAKPCNAPHQPCGASAANRESGLGT
jgi:hypothetical protein